MSEKSDIKINKAENGWILTDHKDRKWILSSLAELPKIYEAIEKEQQGK